MAESWSPRADLLVMDEIHKMPEWKAYLKGVYDGLAGHQSLLVTGSARMETFRQGGASLAGRYFHLRLHPISVREWTDASGESPDDALDRLIERGGMPIPFWPKIRFRRSAGASSILPILYGKILWNFPVSMK